MGIIIDFFHSSGILLSSIDFLNSLVKGISRDGEFLRKFGWILSGPGLLSGLSSVIAFISRFSVISMVVISVLGVYCVGLGGVNAFPVEKVWLNSSANILATVLGSLMRSF